MEKTKSLKKLFLIAISFLVLFATSFCFVGCDPNSNNNKNEQSENEQTQANVYVLNVASSNNDFGTVYGGGTYQENQNITIYAVAKDGYKFVSWNDGNTNAIRTITITQNASFVAMFEQQTAPLSPTEQNNIKVKNALTTSINQIKEVPELTSAWADQYLSIFAAPYNTVDYDSYVEMTRAYAQDNDFTGSIDKEADLKIKLELSDDGIVFYEKQMSESMYVYTKYTLNYNFENNELKSLVLQGATTSVDNSMNAVSYDFETKNLSNNEFTTEQKTDFINQVKSKLPDNVNYIRFEANADLFNQVYGSLLKAIEASEALNVADIDRVKDQVDSDSGFLLDKILQSYKGKSSQMTDVVDYTAINEVTGELKINFEENKIVIQWYVKPNYYKNIQIVYDQNKNFSEIKVNIIQNNGTEVEFGELTYDMQSMIVTICDAKESELTEQYQQAFAQTKQNMVDYVMSLA